MPSGFLPCTPRRRLISGTTSPTTKPSIRSTAPLPTWTVLLREAKKRNIRVVLDMVLNHTSDKHQWFIDAASSRTNPKHDWYVWNDGKPGDGPGAHEGRVPPNNWVSLFGGSAWEWVPAVHQFYYHKFYKQQPDLNWRNPAVEKAMFDTMRFWLDRGVAGFRLDAIPALFEDPQLRDERELGGTNAQGDPNLDDSLHQQSSRGSRRHSPHARDGRQVSWRSRPDRRNLPAQYRRARQVVRRRRS